LSRTSHFVYFRLSLHDALPISGMVLTTDFDTYTIPRADWFPHIELIRTETPSPSNPLGAKGAGDVSNPPVAPTIVNAICDALSRSEEHTSELQSLAYLVCRLLL